VTAGAAGTAAGRAAGGELVSVVIPAHNAAATIGETLDSVRAQTHRQLDIVVVDDGSTDATLDLVHAHAAQDSRVRLLQQSNAGVAAARNAGVAGARSELVAPVDADDLWRPDKIERQLGALQRGGEAVGLVYTWSMLIDERSRIIGEGSHDTDTGGVLRALCRGNIVGNGSSALMRRSAVQAAGGYDASLRQRRAQGCEDYKLYLSIAERWQFAVVPEYLTGYRQGSPSMSSDALQMWRSWQIVEAEVGQRHPELAEDLRIGRWNAAQWLYGRARDSARHADALRLAAALYGLRPRAAFDLTLLQPARRMLRRLAGRPAWRPVQEAIAGRPFLEPSAAQAPR
jgi:glycosyltransferase involved in cell wall biosynthesis